jgi:SRSO17 transposase
MQYELGSEGEQRLARYVDRMGEVLGNQRRRASFATYALGLLGDGERKSVEPIAARACPDPDKVNPVHQQLLHFVSVADWSDRDVRGEAVRYALPAITKHHPITSWILDDTGMLKQGSHSVGVQRQYTGSAGKVTNCQVAVSMCLATPRDHLPVNLDLYLPRPWTDDQSRRREAKIPKEVKFRTKIEIGLDMIRQAIAADLPRGVVLADTAYGDSSTFRRTLRQLDLHYGVAVSSSITVWRADVFESCRGSKIAVKKLGLQLKNKAFRRLTWREGTKKRLSSRFAFRRVVPCRYDGVPSHLREVVWLVMEWEDGKPEPSKFYLSSLPRQTSKKRLVRTIKQRWRTERLFEDLKGELGFDHFEGRLYRGWQHHASVVLCCYAFVAAERALAFSPSARRENRASQDPIAA